MRSPYPLGKCDLRAASVFPLCARSDIFTSLNVGSIELHDFPPGCVNEAFSAGMAILGAGAQLRDPVASSLHGVAGS